jgi:hypothetical protein
MEIEQTKRSGIKPKLAWSCVTAASLQKLAKHLALIACFLIIGGASGRFAPSEIGIFLLVVAASTLHCLGRGIESRLPPALRLPRFGP